MLKLTLSHNFRASKTTLSTKTVTLKVYSARSNMPKKELKENLINKLKSVLLVSLRTCLDSNQMQLQKIATKLKNGKSFHGKK